jgi:hypothetical protein
MANKLMGPLFSSRCIGELEPFLDCFGHFDVKERNHIMTRKIKMESKKVLSILDYGELMFKSLHN